MRASTPESGLAASARGRAAGSAAPPPQRAGDPGTQTAQGSAAAAESGAGTVDADDRTPAAKAS
mgnify:CR=1 FL=1